MSNTYLCLDIKLKSVPQIFQIEAFNKYFKWQMVIIGLATLSYFCDINTISRVATNVKA